MKVAFYAPLKAPDHPVPSGDRTMARALITALEAGGHEVHLASDLRLYDGAGDAQRQRALSDAARDVADQLCAEHPVASCQVWLTYHNYYKAPDLIGPTVARTLGIPYVQIESTRARKRLTGPWATFAAAAEAASDAAHTIFYVTKRDAETLRRDAPSGQALQHLRPFLAQTELPPASTLSGPMLSVGMMRTGDKLASYALIAETLAALPPALDWSLDIAGDGEAAADVAALMAPFGPRVRMLGALDRAKLTQLYGRASLLFWPGVNEAFGLAYLEAQAAGVPVVAQDRPGVRDVTGNGQPGVDAGPAAMAGRITDLLQHPHARRAAGTDARARVARDHLLGSATATLNTVLGQLA